MKRAQNVCAFAAAAAAAAHPKNFIYVARGMC